MADLDPLIRLRKYKVEEKQKVLAELFREAERYEAKKAGLLESLESERRLVEQKDEFDAYSAYILFAERVRGEIALIDERIERLSVKIMVAQDEMRTAFGDMKKVEIIQKAREVEERVLEAKKDAGILDEVGIEGFRRRDDFLG